MPYNPAHNKLRNGQPLGGMSRGKTVASDTAASQGDVIIADTSTGSLTITLPPPSTTLEVTVIKSTDPNTVTIATPMTETISGQAEQPIQAAPISRTIVSDGTDYFIK